MQAKCDNCDKVFDADKIKVELFHIKRLPERLTPGDPVPYGECPDCGALVYVVKPKLTMRVLWGASATGISFEEFDSQAGLDGYLRALNDHAGWLESETHFPDENGKFEDLDEDTRKSLLVNYEEVDLEP